VWLICRGASPTALATAEAFKQSSAGPLVALSWSGGVWLSLPLWSVQRHVLQGVPPAAPPGPSNRFRVRWQKVVES